MMNDDEIKKLRIQQIMDQQQATWDEARTLLREGFDVPYYGSEYEKESTDKLSDYQAFKLLNYFNDAPLESWIIDTIWPEVKAAAMMGQAIPYPPMPFLLNWIGEDEIVVRTTLTFPLSLFAAGWRARGMEERSRIGDYDLTRECLTRIADSTGWVIENKPGDIEYLAKMKALHLAVRVAVRALDEMPDEWKDNEEQQNARAEAKGEADAV